MSPDACENDDMPPDHATTLDDGRVLAADEYGTPTGRPVLFLPSAPGSRKLDPDDHATRAAGIRLVVTDRAGYGCSTAHAEDATPTWALAAADHAALVDDLGLAPVHVVGWSNGGLGALALAARYPSLVTDVTVVGTPAPHDEVPWVPEEFVGLLTSLRSEPGCAMAQLLPALAPLASHPEAALGSISSGPADEQLLHDPAARDRLAVMIDEAFRQGAAGLAADIVATNVVPWGFSLDAVEAPVRLLYGDEDVIVPPVHGEYYAEALDRAQLTVLPGTGHLAPLPEWRRLLAVEDGVVDRL